LRSALTESDSSLLLELLSPDADAPPAEALMSLLEADVEVAAVVDVCFSARGAGRSGRRARQWLGD
jgi:hypothetical protein